MYFKKIQHYTHMKGIDSGLKVVDFTSVPLEINCNPNLNQALDKILELGDPLDVDDKIESGELDKIASPPCKFIPVNMFGYLFLLELYYNFYQPIELIYHLMQILPTY